MFNLDLLVKVVFARFLHCKIAVFPFPYFIFRGESLSLTYPQSGRGNLRSFLFKNVMFL